MGIREAGVNTQAKPPLSAAEVSKPPHPTYDHTRYHQLKADGCCTSCAEPLSLADLHKYTRCRKCRLLKPATAQYKRRRRDRLVQEHRCVDCTSPLAADHAGRRCPGCASYHANRIASRRASGELADDEDEVSVMRSPAVVQAEIDRGDRCPTCYLLRPCHGHETLSIDFHASRRIGEAGGT